MVHSSAMLVRLLAALVFVTTAVVIGWYAMVRTVHLGTLAVPDVRGAPLVEVEEQAHDLGLKLVVEEPGVFSSSVPLGAVAAQEPQPGFHVKTGSTVTVRLSLGSERVAIPDLIGESLQASLRGLEQHGLKPGQPVQIAGHGSGDQVVASEPPVGAETAPGSAVQLLVNETPRRELWVMPSLLSSSHTAVRRFCRSNQLRLGQVHEVSYPGIPDGLVLRQYPPAGSPVSRSDIITVWVSK